MARDIQLHVGREPRAYTRLVSDNVQRSDAPAVTTVLGNNYDWSDLNPPWGYTDPAVFTEGWGSPTIVNIATGSTDFYTNLVNTVNAAGGRVVVRLGTGVYHLKSFRLAGTSGNPLYSFGFYIPNLRGFLGDGPDKTFVQMDANSMSSAQLSALAPFTGNPLQMGLCRLDGTASSPILLGGLTFRAADQQMFTASVAHGTIPCKWPQPAPHQGVVLCQNSVGILNNVRFQGAGRACNSGPPFEMANVNTQYGTTTFRRCEFDGRRSPDLDPARPRRCTVYMGNNDDLSTFTDSWMHHTNVSRYAVNDQNRDTQGTYSLTRVKIEQITNTQNVDPALNGGVSLGGYENACLCGFESSKAFINFTDCIMSVDNPFVNGMQSRHIQFTNVGTNPAGGRITVKGGQYRNTAWPWLANYLTFRIRPNTHWYSDGINTTVDVRNSSNVRLTPFEVSSWPPSAATLSAAGVSPTTHFLVGTP